MQTERRRPALVVFDMAGTTVRDGEGAVARCLVEALAADGVTVSQGRANAFMGIPKPLAIAELLGAAGSTERVAAIHADFVRRMLAFYATDPAVGSIPGTEETFDRLRSAGVRVALDTGFSRDIADTILRRLAWEGRIDGSVTSDEVANGRPFPDLILALMERFGISDAATVAKVGDTPADLNQGTAAGCGWVIGVTEGSHTHDQLVVCPHTHLIPNVATLPALFGL
ncbi:MAG: HAD hydrolase-like protein [Capsulimonadales bacterium]|nr:HAD hydrolase-like protein [Capsulimonadales bacterium]